jgi:hypothetical protein
MSLGAWRAIAFNPNKSGRRPGSRAPTDELGGHGAWRHEPSSVIVRGLARPAVYKWRTQGAAPGASSGFVELPKVGRVAMRRLLVGSLVTIAVVLVPGAAASAAPGQVLVEHFNGVTADAEWSWGTATFGVGTRVGVEQNHKGYNLVVVQDRFTLDTDGNPTSHTVTEADATSGFSFSMDSARYTGATLAAAGLPATTCTYDADFNPVGDCTKSTVGINVTWTGQGPITHVIERNHSVTPGVFVLVSGDNSTGRSARNDGTAQGLLPLGTAQGGFLSRLTQGLTIVCIGGDWDTCFSG